ncbi:gamma-glutamylcyclotransferase family protein [Marinomonas sp. THO17]|uniref:gamma-glutamylcyclotransferase family protein n=1 Tax=Marinomonas sp. THO17 TaxID=3149048 RepID=UPI00336BF97D
MVRVFVYGTLKEGFPNFHLNHGKRLDGDFVTQQSFPLYLIGERHSPWLMLSAGLGHPIKGQVFSVSDEILAAMDKLERCDQANGYKRVTVQVMCLQTGNVLEVYMYGKPSILLDIKEIKAELHGEYGQEHARLYRSRSL